MAGIEDGTQFVQGFIDYERGEKPMNMKMKLFSYNYEDTLVHRLSGLTKLICFLLLTFAVMFSYDIRVILARWCFPLSCCASRASVVADQADGVVCVHLPRDQRRDHLFLLPGAGGEIYGTQARLSPNSLAGIRSPRSSCFTRCTKFFKYASVIPLGIIFLLTTNPSELASSLNGMGVHYKAAFAVSLTLRYFPDVQRDYHDISQAQQARGLEMTRKTSVGQRFKNSLLVVIPLIFSTLDRIEVISNAMDLRGFGKEKRRTWYNKSKLKAADIVAIALCTVFLVVTVCISVFINHGRFYNPFL